VLLCHTMHCRTGCTNEINNRGVTSTPDTTRHRRCRGGAGYECSTPDNRNSTPRHGASLPEMHASQHPNDNEDMT
jgi:hypothetical protein